MSPALFPLKHGAILLDTERPALIERGTAFTSDAPTKQLTVADTSVDAIFEIRRVDGGPDS
jgi:hypothetical protein